MYPHGINVRRLASTRCFNLLSSPLPAIRFLTHSLSLALSLAPALLLGPWLGPRNYNFGRIYDDDVDGDDDTVERILVLELFTPFGGVLAHRVGLIISFSAKLGAERETTRMEKWKRGVRVEDPEGASLGSFSGALMRLAASFSPDANRFNLSTLCFYLF